MRITGNNNMQQVLNCIFDQKRIYLIDRDDFDKFFPTMDGVQAFLVTGNDIQDVISQIREELDGVEPTALFAYYLGRCLKMSDVPLLDEAFPQAVRWKRGLIFEDLPGHPITVLAFWKEKTGGFDLDRFIEAQRLDYPLALEEMKEGHKVSHWIWYIFPQLKGLGHSYNATYYGLDGIEEARAYYNHPVLRARLREITEAVLSHKGTIPVEELMGSRVDAIKLRSCMELFDRVSPNDIFAEVLKFYYTTKV